MPIKNIFDENEVKCIPICLCVNHEMSDHLKKSTMQIADGEYVLMAVDFVDKDSNWKETNQGAPVKLLICSVCGYVEIYSSIVLNKLNNKENNNDH
jgi:hypothetical protein